MSPASGRVCAESSPNAAPSSSSWSSKHSVATVRPHDYKHRNTELTSGLLSTAGGWYGTTSKQAVRGATGKRRRRPRELAVIVTGELGEKSLASLSLVGGTLHRGPHHTPPYFLIFG